MYQSRQELQTRSEWWEYVAVGDIAEVEPKKVKGMVVVLLVRR